MISEKCEGIFYLCLTLAKSNYNTKHNSITPQQQPH